MKTDSVPPFVAEAQRRYEEMLENMSLLHESVKRVLDMPPDVFQAWIEGLDAGQRACMVSALACLITVPPPKYEDFLCDELNRRHGLTR